MKYASILTVTLMLVIGFSLSSFAQSKEMVILIDGKAKEVMMSPDGKIEYVIRDVPNYLSNYKNSESNYFPNSQGQGNYGASAAGSNGYLNEVFKVIYFLPEMATLSDATIEKLDAVAKEALRSGKRVMMQTAYSSNHINTRKLSDNRLSAIKAYLGVKGVSLGLIAEALDEKSKPSAKVNIFLK